MDVGTCNGWQAADVVSSSQLRERIAARWPLRALDAEYRGEVAERYAYADGQGEIGFVSSVSQPFCGDCHRARLSADGQLFTCLFAASGHRLRHLLQGDDAALDAAIATVWNNRTDRYSELRKDLRSSTKHVEMYAIGG
jgi:cyclic pyranopterin phosphate synthase